MTRHSRRALLVACAAALTSCSRHTTKQPAPSDASAPAPPVPSTIEGMPVQPPSDSTGDADGLRPADASDADKQAAITAARATLGVWVQGRVLDERTWRDQLNATLTPAGQQALTSAWGYRVRDTAVAGGPTIVRANAGSAVLEGTTDYTTYTLTVVRTEGDTWKTAALTPGGGGVS